MAFIIKLWEGLEEQREDFAYGRQAGDWKRGRGEGMSPAFARDVGGGSSFVTAPQASQFQTTAEDSDLGFSI